MQMFLLSCTAETASVHSRSLSASTRGRGGCTLREELRTCLLLRYNYIVIIDKKSNLLFFNTIQSIKCMLCICLCAARGRGGFN